MGLSQAFEKTDKEKNEMENTKKTQYFCNPLNMDYRYQFIHDEHTGQDTVSREAADPSMILFQGKYYIFASMTLSVWVSEDMVNWESHRLPDNLPLYDYAPDVRVVGDYVYFSASRRGTICDFYRTKDVLNGPYERIPGTFDFWDPNLFLDDDGKLYFYWGCNSITPIWGAELDPETMHQLHEPVELIEGHPEKYGYERFGEDHSLPVISFEEAEELMREMKRKQGKSEELTDEEKTFARMLLTHRPFIEGAWMTKHNGRYYLQYACPGTEFNIYGDGVYESDFPLGPFHVAGNNPYSYKPGGFLRGAGHGSTMEDKYENLWHTATMQISKNHNFERRVGIWQAGFDKDGVLFCSQRYGDWPMAVEQGKMDPWKEPEWYLLSYGKTMTASSFTEGKGPEKAADENVQTWWQAAGNQPGEWLAMDLGKPYDVRAIQINFADDKIDLPSPGELQGERFIDPSAHKTRWILEGSADGDTWQVLEDKSKSETNLPHDLVLREDGVTLQYLRVTVLEVPFEQKPCISGLRVFGKGDGEKPAVPDYTVKRTGTMDMDVKVRGSEDDRATGYVILWGMAPDKLYHSCMTFAPERTIGALMEGQKVYVRVDAFNENGITEGTVVVEVE